MTVNKPVWMQATGGDTALQYSAQELRAVLEGMFKTEGILPAVGATACKVTQRGAGANFSVDIAPGHALITGDDVAGQGMYLVKVSATENLVTPTAPGSGTRVHRVVLQIRDKLHLGTWTTYDCVPVLLQDTGSGTPATPNSALSLALVSIAAAQANVSNANITDIRLNARVANLLMDPIEQSTQTNVTTNSLTFVSLGSPLALTFVAPSSGSVWVNIDSSLENADSGQGAYMGFEIRNNTVAGSVFRAANDSDACQVQGPQFSSFGKRVLVTGLTPGNLYFIREMCRSGSASFTASFFYRKINVEPVA
jgi:hypothetical protein